MKENPGMHSVKISPRTGKRLEWAKGSYESAYGKLAVEWKRERTAGQGDRIVLLLTVPAQYHSRIYLEPEAEEPLLQRGWLFRRGTVHLPQRQVPVSGR